MQYIYAECSAFIPTFRRAEGAHRIARVGLAETPPRHRKPGSAESMGVNQDGWLRHRGHRQDRVSEFDLALVHPRVPEKG